MDLEQPPLFTPALSGVSFTAYWRYPTGWHITATHQREGDAGWGHRRSWDGFATDELPQLLEDWMATLVEPEL